LIAKKPFSKELIIPKKQNQIHLVSNKKPQAQGPGFEDKPETDGQVVSGLSGPVKFRQTRFSPSRRA
jgi:hypothetical protein